PAKLTFIFVLLPVVVIVLMIVFWMIFKETRKQVEVTDSLSGLDSVSVICSVAPRIDDRFS
ncbi:MAG: hypothetical protein ACSHWU_12950, partial [Marinicella sp.]